MKRLVAVLLCLLLLTACGGCAAGNAGPASQADSVPSQDTSAPTSEPVTQPAAGTYTPGTYEVTVRGMSGKFAVEVTFDAENIVSIEVPVHHETENIGTRAIDEVIPAMIEAQSTEVDGVSGATITSNALKSAVAQAIEMAVSVPAS